MKLPMKWLADFVNIGNINIEYYCDRMTNTGSKVEGYETLASDINNVLVGHILSIEPHADSDHLLVCKIDVGNDTVLQIVTGAHNIKTGDYVPVAVAPAKLPNGVVIQKNKLRGVSSDGMLCSISELGLTLHEIPYAEENGILILNNEENLIAGTDIKDVLMINDDVVEFEITPNRPDCLSVIGLARETGATFELPVKYHEPKIKNTCDNIEKYINVEVRNTELCPRYTARIVKNVKIKPSPLWMRMRLHAAGIRPINNIVDITNYVMLEYGQPMHAFDYKCINGNKIIVRNAEENENFISLDNIPHTLKNSMLVIADDIRPVALAGVMGGQNSEINDETTIVVFESANFNGPSVRITGRSLGMRTESSGRFEKGLNPEMTLPAVERACELVELLCAGDIVDGIIDVYENKQYIAPVELDSERINKFLGTNINKEKMISILESLDFIITNDIINVPSHRADIESIADISEEIIRIYGYDKIEATPFKSGVKRGMYEPRIAYKQRINNLLCNLGYYENYSFSFISEKYYEKIRQPYTGGLRIINPLGEDTSVMRTALLPSVMESLSKNYNNGAKNACLFETSTVFIPNEDSTKLPSEPMVTAIAAYGIDFYDIKGTIEEILYDAGINDIKFKSCQTNLTFHPGRCAEVFTNNILIGILGELHPITAQNYNIDNERVYAAVIDTEKIFKLSSFTKTYKPLPKYPSVTRDLAFICDESLEAGNIEELIYEISGIIKSINVFDVYRGVNLPQDKKSIALSITLQSDENTLTDEDINKIMAQIIEAAKQKYNITLRS